MQDMIKMALKNILKDVGGVASERRMKGPAVVMVKKETMKPVEDEEFDVSGLLKEEDEGSEDVDVSSLFTDKEDGEEDDGEPKEVVGKDLDESEIEKVLAKRKKGA